MNAWLAIDSGGTKTHLLLADTQGKTLREAHCPGVGVPVDEEDKPLPELVSAARDVSAGYTVVRVVINLGGKNENQLRRQLNGLFPEARIDIFRESSGVLAGQLGKKYGADVVILLGTGTIAIASGPLGTTISDGWGCIVGDAGSGYWIGLEAISRSLYALEGEGPLSCLAQEITGCAEPFQPVADAADLMRRRDAIRAFIRLPLDRAATAAYARIAAAHAERGDEMAKRIFSDAGEKVAACALRALRKVGISSGGRVLIIGGLTNVHTLWEDAFQRALYQGDPQARWEIRRVDLTGGAIAYLQNSK